MVEDRIRGRERGLSMASIGWTERLVFDTATGKSGLRASTTATDRAFLAFVAEAAGSNGDGQRHASEGGLDSLRPPS
jgi:hypothetical protein